MYVGVFPNLAQFHLFLHNLPIFFLLLLIFWVIYPYFWHFTQILDRLSNHPWFLLYFGWFTKSLTLLPVFWSFDQKVICTSFQFSTELPIFYTIGSEIWSFVHCFDDAFSFCQFLVLTIHFPCFSPFPQPFGGHSCQIYLVDRMFFLCFVQVFSLLPFLTHLDQFQPFCANYNPPHLYADRAC
jgi:hypothetical protein